MSKHTNGPWEIAEIPRIFNKHHVGPVAAKANAQLAAAAPDLLAALKELLDSPYDEHGALIITGPAMSKVMAAIAKAEGK